MTRVAYRLPVEGGETVFCEVAGAGTPIVLTHDGLLHRESWDAQFESFSAHHRVLRWDRRGYGLSDEPSVPYSSIDDLARVIGSTSDAPATLIGCSFGALLSLHCALDYPELIAALVLVGPIVSGLGYTEHFLSRGGRFRTSDLTPAEEIEYWTRTDPWFVAPSNGAARTRLSTLLEANPRNLQPKEGLERRPESPALARLRQIAVPTLIITGEHDIPDVHAHSGVIAAGIAGSRRLVLSDCAHVPHFEVPEVFDKTVFEFLSTGT